jgi:methyl-accepting chemotaxis protein
MTDLILIVIAALLGVIVAVLIPTLLELRRSALRTQRFLDETAAPLRASLTELGETLRSVSTMAGHLSGVAEDLRTFSSALSRTAVDMGRAAASVESLTRRARASVSAFRVGLNVAWDVLLRSLFSTKGGKS